MRTYSAALAVLGLSALALTGCTAAPTFDGASCLRTDAAHGIGDAVTLEGALGEAPKATVYAPLHVEQTAFTDVIVGDGRALTSQNQPMVIEMSIFSGETGEKVLATSYDSASTAPTTIAQWAAQSPGLADALACATSGTRVLAALTPDGFGTENLEGLGMKKDDTAVFVIDVVDALLPKAEGAPQFNDARGLPTVVRAPDGTPGIIIPDTAAPKELVAETLIRGDGETLTAEQTPVVNFTAMGWDEKDIRQTTWGSAPSTQLQQIAAPVAEALVGLPVGTQLMVVLPETEASSAIVVVVDLLGVTTVPAR